MSVPKKRVPRPELCRGFYQLPGLEIQVGETQTLIPAGQRNCPVGHLFRLANGDVVAGGQPAYSPCPQDHEDCVPASMWRRSSDGGRTWRDIPPWPTYIPYQFPDGEIIHLASGAAGAYLRQGESAGAYETLLFRSTDDGYTHRQ